ncbi:MAG: NrsF family protein [Gammaproteobacteria bacterium]
MRTDDLIAALAADRHPPAAAPLRAQGLALLLGGLVSLVALVGSLGLRADFQAALATWRFDVKLVLVASALLLAFIDCVRLASPVERGWAMRANLLIPILLGAAVAAELVLAPVDSWRARLVGTNAAVCLVVIPLLSLPTLVFAMIAMRTMAPSSAPAAGAAVGRLAAAVAATLYALHCFDDSPLFVATWYSLATLAVVLLGAAVGRRVLRW